MEFLTLQNKGLVLEIVVQPRSSRLAVGGRHAGALKLQLTAPPAGGEANRQCLQFLGKLLRLPSSQMRILSGRQNRRKRVLIQEGDAADLNDLRSRVEQILECELDKK